MRGPGILLQEAVWDQGLVWTGAEILTHTGIWFLDYPACSGLLYWLSSAGPFWYGYFGSNETTSHPPKPLHMPYKLGVMIGYLACESAVVSLCVTGEIAVVAPHWDSSFVRESGAQILSKALHLRQVERLPCHLRLGYVFSMGTDGHQCCCWPSHVGTTVVAVSLLLIVTSNVAERWPGPAVIQFPVIDLL